MDKPIVLSRSIRFVEALAFLSLVFRVVSAPLPGVEALPIPILVPAVVTLGLMMVGLGLVRIRPISWLGLLVTGIVSVLIQPLESDGLLWVLAAAFAFFHDGWLVRRPAFWTGLLVTLILGAQVGSLVLHAGSWVPVLVGLTVADGLLGFLAFSFRRYWLMIPPETRPVLLCGNGDLTDRELQLVHLIWGGETPKMIAGQLGLSETTVRKSLSRVYVKLGVPGLKELSQLVHTHRIVLEDQADLSREQADRTQSTRKVDPRTFYLKS